MWRVGSRLREDTMTEEAFHQRIIEKYERKLARIQRDEGRDAMRSRWPLIQMLFQHRRALCSIQDLEWSVGVYVPLLPAEDPDMRVESGDDGSLVIRYHAERKQSREEFVRFQEQGAPLEKHLLTAIRVDCPLHLEITPNGCYFPHDRQRELSKACGFGGRTRSGWGERFNGFCFEIENSREVKRLREQDSSNYELHHWRLWLGTWLVEVVGCALALPDLPLTLSTQVPVD